MGILPELEKNRAVRSPYVAYLYGIILSPRICLVTQYFARGSLDFVLKNPNFEMNWTVFFKFAKDIILVGLKISFFFSFARASTVYIVGNLQ
jgi:hypothetical protein